MNAKVTQLAPIRIAMLRHIGPYDEVSAVFDSLFVWVESQAVPVQRTIGIYYDNPDYVSASRLRAAACVEIPSTYQIGDRCGLPIEIGEISGGSYVTTRFIGPYEDMAPIWTALTNHTEKTLGLRISQNPAFEVYVNDASVTPPSQLITDLYMPVR